jgi:phosphopantetheinyl transferase (holo-ACP synthase)
METKSLTWSFEETLTLLACGIDSERIGRFRDWTSGADAAPAWIFSGAEREHFLALAEPSRGCCASFCCKEAVLKALGEPFDYRACELLYHPGDRVQEIRLDRELAARHGVGRSTAVILVNALDEEEMIVAAYLFAGEERPS